MMNGFTPTKPTEPMKKWASEPALLGDYGDEWIKERDNTEENGVSFTQQVTQPSLENVTKQRVQLRPKRRPPSRGFVKSMASLDDISLPEDIQEEDEEDEEDEEEGDTEEDLGVMNDAVKGHVKPLVAPKPSDPNAAWKLPKIDPNMLLKKTSSSETQCSIQEEDISTKIPENPGDPVSTPESPPLQKGKQKPRSKRFKFQLFKFRRSKENGKKYEMGGPEGVNRDTNSNLAVNNSISVDSGSRPLGEEESKGWQNRRRRKTEGERRRLSWLMQLFHIKHSTHDSEANNTEDSTVPPLPSNGNHGNTNSSDTGDIETTKTQENGHALEIKTENGLTNADAPSHDENPETVSDLKKKFERISAGF